MTLIVRYAWTLGLAGSVLLGGAAIGYYAAGRMDGAPTWLAFAGSLLLIAYPVLDREYVGATFTSRQVVQNLQSFLVTVLFGAVAVALYALAERNDTTWDLTSDAQHTLAGQSVKVAAGLATPIEVLAFFPSGHGGEVTFRRMTDLMQEHTSMLNVQMVDPIRQPRLASTNEVTGDHGTVIVRNGETERRLEWPFDEERLVESLLMITTDVTHKVCWSVGHGEPDPDDGFDKRGLGAVVVELENLNYQVMRQPIATSGIARDCALLVVVRPSTEWLPFELEALAAYVGEGGGVMVLLEPGLTPGFADEMARYGLLVGDDLVIDVNPNNQMMGVDDPSFVVLSGRGFIPHPITETLAAAIVFPMARTVSPDGQREGVQARGLLQTSEAAWGEHNPDADTVGPDADELQGEVPVAAVAQVEDPSVLDVAESTAVPRQAPDVPMGEGGQGSSVEGRAPEPLDFGGDDGRAVPADYTPQPGGRVVVFGDSDFASNVFLTLGNNRDLFMNTVAWLAEEEGQLGERPEQGDTLEITSFGEAMVCIVSIVLVPGGALLLAIATMLRRRRL